ncbi:hypothetical protein ACMBCM_04250 [Spiroplasma sp. K1]
MKETLSKNNNNNNNNYNKLVWTSHDFLLPEQNIFNTKTLHKKVKNYYSKLVHNMELI